MAYSAIIFLMNIVQKHFKGGNFMFNEILNTYKGALSILSKKPILLWGLSLLSSFLTVLAAIFGVLPIIYLPIIFALQAGLCCLYLKGYRGEEVKTDDIFVGFKKNFLHIAGGMAWKTLWIVLWALIPIVGIVFAVIKAYEYAFTPYILINHPEISATEALKKSKEMTNGYKLKMFLSVILVEVALCLVGLILGSFAAIPYIGWLFALVSFAVNLAVALFSGIFFGLIKAGFYDAAEKAAYPVAEEPASQLTVPAIEEVPVSVAPANETPVSE